jgi:hypothetical protein
MVPGKGEVPFYTVSSNTGTLLLCLITPYVLPSTALMNVLRPLEYRSH